MNPKIQQRDVPVEAYNAALDAGYTPLQSRIIAARMPALRVGEGAAAVSPTLASLDQPGLLPDIDIAARRIADAVIHGEIIGCVSDHDVDGQTSTSVVKTALCDFFRVPPSKFLAFASHRMREGYGVSNALAERILDAPERPTLVITCDQGSTDEPRFAKLLEHGIQTIVTDHHIIPESGIPLSAIAVINPTRADSRYPDPSIAGCYVAFLVMCAVREELLRRNWLPPSAPKLTSLLDWVACGTVADCSNLSTSRNNRAVVRYGLYLMNTQPRACWKAMRTLLGTLEPFTAETLGFQVGPRLNCSGRVDDSMRSVEFLTCKSEDEASRLLLGLDQQNRERRAIQDTMQVFSRPIAALQAASCAAALVIYMPDGHAGIHGICASRHVETHGRPTVCFSPKQGVEGVLTGSLRSIDGVHILKALRRADVIAGGDLFLSCGGHSAAGGCAIKVSDLPRFQDAFREAVAEQCDPTTMGPAIATDGGVTRAPDMAMLAEISALEPFGRQFPAPVFEGRFRVCNVKAVGDGRHLKLGLSDAAGCNFSAIWFGARPDSVSPLPVVEGDLVSIAYTLGANTFRGNTTVDLKVLTAVQLEEKDL